MHAVAAQQRRGRGEPGARERVAGPADEAEEHDVEHADEEEDPGRAGDRHVHAHERVDEEAGGLGDVQLVDERPIAQREAGGEGEVEGLVAEIDAEAHAPKHREHRDGADRDGGQAGRRAEGVTGLHHQRHIYRRGASSSSG